MADIEEQARRLLATEYARGGSGKRAARILEGIDLAPGVDYALRAIEAALASQGEKQVGPDAESAASAYERYRDAGATHEQALHAALADALASQAQPVEMSPEFTDTARAAIAWVLWHHQGGSSPVGQPLRFALGMGDHDPLSESQIAEAKRYAEWSGATTEAFHQASVQVPDDVRRDAERFAWLEKKCNAISTYMEGQHRYTLDGDFHRLRGPTLAAAIDAARDAAPSPEVDRG